MMTDVVRDLERRNRELLDRVEHDGLTGLLNREGFERRVRESLGRDGHGTMFVMDMDYFKDVNDQYGHMAGDMLLRETADGLRELLPGMLVARVGGDEFAAFTGADLGDNEASATCGRIRYWFGTNRFLDQVRASVGMTAEYARSDRGRYQELFDAADQKLMERKRSRNRGGDGARGRQDGGEAAATDKDLELLLKEMNEGIAFDGAYMEDYQTFCRMYQLEVRRQKRLDNSVHLMLVTLVGSDGEFLPLDRRRTEMDVLGGIISSRMRLGDVYCRYSASQYLILAMDTTEEQAETILGRIRDAYDRARPDAGARLVPHQCCPLSGTDPVPDPAPGESG